MLNLRIKQVASALAAMAVLAMVFGSVFADVTSVARTQHDYGHARSFAAFVTSLGL
jgi:hypothetical protein